MMRFEYALSLDEEEDADVFGEARGSFEGVEVGDMVGLLEKARGEVGTLGSRGERERRSGEDERGEDMAGV